MLSIVVIAMAVVATPEVPLLTILRQPQIKLDGIPEIQAIFYTLTLILLRQ